MCRALQNNQVPRQGLRLKVHPTGPCARAVKVGGVKALISSFPPKQLPGAPAG